MRAALRNLRAAGCTTVYVNGSFVTAKEVPGDFDACWECDGVDIRRLDPTLHTFDDSRAAQKDKYRGELFPNVRMRNRTCTFLEFFQVDRVTGRRKGIIVLDLRGGLS